MARTRGALPAARPDAGARANRISKAGWIELYADLYTETHGGTGSPEQIVADAERRHALLAQAGGPPRP